MLRKQFADLRPVRRSTFVNDSRGVTSIEYALLLAAVVATVAVAMHVFTLATGKTFYTLANAVNTNAPSHDDATDLLATETPLDGMFSPAQQSIQAGHRRLLLEMLFLFTVLCTSVWALSILRRQRRCREQDEEQAKEQAKMQAKAQAKLPDAQMQKFLEKRQQILRLLTNDVSRIFESRIRVCHLMSTRIMSVKPSAGQEQMRDIMMKHRIRHILVCDDDSKLLGIISNRDFCNHAKTKVRARCVMTANPATVSPNTTISVAITMMMEKNISCLPVVENGRVKGVLTTTDLMLSLQCTLQILMKVATDTELLDEVLDTLDVSPESLSPEYPVEQEPEMTAAD